MSFSRFQRNKSIWVLCFLLLSLGCARYRPAMLEADSFLKRAETKTDGQVTITMAVLTPEESRQVYGVNLSYRWIQPVWINIENRDTVPYWLLKTGLDPEYFSALETAYKYHGGLFSKRRNAKIDQTFHDLAYKGPVMPGQSNSGFVLTNLNLGAKNVSIDLVSIGKAKHFSFFSRLPNAKLDYEGLNPDDLYKADQIIELDDAGLRKVLEELPTHTTDKKGKALGDPVNLVMIGGQDELFPALIRRGWRVTEKTYLASALKTMRSFFLGSKYLFSPISSLYLYGRPQDIGLQKPRGSINERNHMRFWLSPYRYQGKRIWVGQISRDIGVRFTKKIKPPITHAVDPDLDESRGAIIEDMMYSQSLSKLGFVKGSAPSTQENPVKKMMGDFFFTDGLRAVMEFTTVVTPLSGIQLWDWEKPRLWNEKLQQTK